MTGRDKIGGLQLPSRVCGKVEGSGEDSSQREQQMPMFTGRRSHEC